MIKFQKIIKYLAIAFAAVIIFNIFAGIVSVIAGINFLNSGTKKVELLDKYEEVVIGDNIDDLEVEVATVNVEIKASDKFRVETNRKDINVETRGNKVKISEKNRRFINAVNTGEIIIYVPESINLKNLEFENGAGNVSICDVNAESISLELGAGNIEVNNVVSKKNTNIDGGAGRIEIKNSELSNLDLDMGVGNLTLHAKLFGNSKIDCGVGELKMNLIGNSENYKVKVDKGLGTVKIKGDNIEGSYGNGENTIDIDGGVGTIQIDFEDIED